MGGDDKIKEDLQAMMGGMSREIGERAVCNIAIDPEFVPPEDADANIAWGAKMLSINKFRVNSYTLEIIEAKGMRNHPCDPYVVIKNVQGSIGDERKTEIC